MMAFEYGYYGLRSKLLPNKSRARIQSAGKKRLEAALMELMDEEMVAIYRYDNGRVYAGCDMKKGRMTGIEDRMIFFDDKPEALSTDCIIDLVPISGLSKKPCTDGGLYLFSFTHIGRDFGSAIHYDPVRAYLARTSAEDMEKIGFDSYLELRSIKPVVPGMIFPTKNI